LPKQLDELMIGYGWPKVNRAMSRASFVFFALIVVFAVLILSSIGHLPAKIAVHFDTNSAPDKWVSREEYGIYALLFVIGLPLILFAIMAGLPRLTSGKGFIPNNEYWFADETKQQTESFLLQHSSWLGTMTAAVLYGIHVLLTRANELDPPKLSIDRFSIMVFLYLCGLAWWITAFFRHFQKPMD
jgi:uncharacterized membrane protein